MLRPASSTSVRSPRRVSSQAAMPPVIPAPTTMASYRSGVIALALLPSRGHAAIEPAGNHLLVHHAFRDLLRREVSVDREALDRGERVAGAVQRRPAAVESTEQRGALVGAERHERPAEGGPALDVDGIEPGHEFQPVRIGEPLAREKVDELRD